MTAGSKGPESVLQRKMLLVDGEKQRPRVRTAAEDLLGRRREAKAQSPCHNGRCCWLMAKSEGPESVLQLKTADVGG